MNNLPDQTPPEPANENMEKWEAAVRDTVRHFVYPPTPDIAAGVRARLKAQPRRSLVHSLRLAAAALLALAVVTLAIPQTRAFVLEALRVGVVRIFFGEPTTTPTAMPTPTAMGAGTISPTWTPRPAYTPIASPLDLPGETTLADAEQQLGSTILLPTYPDDLGVPDHIYAQEIGQGVVVTIIWLKGDDSRQVDLLLQVLNRDAVAAKYFPWDASNQERVHIENSPQAFWLTDVHRLYFYETEGEISRVVDKDVLLWDMRPLTYRLETDLPLEEAIRVAESLE
jgi:hypothetical protein